MWPPWAKNPSGKSPAAAATVSSCSSPLARSHPSFSFKDVQTLIHGEDTDATAPGSPAISRGAAVFHRVRAASSALRTWRSICSPAPDPGPNRIVLYFTSLRVVRKTFEDCRAVRSILRGFRIAVDERDLSMDSSFLHELSSLLGQRQPPPLPRVFIAGRYIGGADEIRQLHEAGELRRLVEGAPPAGATCDRCGGASFVLCWACSGSHKRYLEKGGFRSCAACNENGLVRCPDCSFPAV
ncbi:putative glutaredoxin, Thioredoxin-like superfamily [Dioscorea sansibarensis]